MPRAPRLWRLELMESALKDLAGLIGLFCELATVIVVAIGAAEALVRLLAVAVNVTGPPALKRQVWVRFAAWILLALEFALAADIVRSAIAPSWDDIGQLAAIAAIRTFLNYFLAKDVESFQRDTDIDRKAGGAGTA